ncbi:uncharacterized protein LOC112684358 [Sipha flava]|uniref:Uncharacterized protein LOC112684358 n=2 Tax=Sipha flava TaxID=143950 RepID=A0A8B8FMB5_9HEMI|nr:uncharacterized protein LOC112684358 [Sipha flava]
MSSKAMQVLTTVLCALFVASASAAPCPRPCKCFADVNGIQAANCTELPVRAATAWPQKILRLQLAGDRAAVAAPMVLRDKAFGHFPRLTYLDVSGRAVQHVAALAFDGLPELVELNLARTGVKKLDRRAFAGNRKLAFLSLRGNPGLTVSPSFLVSDSITELDVSACGLTALKSVYFSGLPNLKYLFAANNRLKALGSQFAPPGIKYVDLANNRIGHVDDDLEAYKRLRTVDLTGNPINCTCELSDVDRKLTARGVAFGNTVTCANTGLPLDDMAEVCSADDKDMLGDDPKAIYKSDDLLEVDDGMMSAGDDRVDGGSGSGSGDGAPPVFSTPSDVAGAENESNGSVENTSSQRPDTTSEETTSEEAIPGETASEETTTDETVSGDPTSGESTSEAETSVTTGSEETTDETSTVPVVPVDEVISVKVSARPDSAVDHDGGTTTTTTTTTVAVDHDIVSNPILLPKDEVQEQHSLVAAVDYLRSNVAVTGTAVILAVLIMAIVYKAVCAGKSRSRRTAEADGKTVELKEIKYIAADTEDSRNRDDDDRDELTTPSSSAEENLLEDRGDDTDDSDDSDDVQPSPSAVVDAMKANGDAAATNVPTRVIVKLGETPKASRPVTIDNVH